jgi:hypothetical protein
VKIQCPSCRDIVELQEFTTSEAGLQLRCPACRKVTFLANPRSLQDEATPGAAVTPGAPERARVGGVTCPKCGHAQSDPAACHRCGLVFSKFDPQALPPDPPEAAAAWRRIEASPGDEGLHEQFLAACDRAGRLDYATRQYRLLAQQGGSPELLARAQQRILQLAQAKLLPGGLQPSDRDAAKNRTRWVVYAILLAAVGLLSYLIYTAGDFMKTMR